MKKFTALFFASCATLFLSSTSAQNVALDWVTQSGGTGTDQGYSIAQDPQGNVVVGGQFESVADFDPGTGLRYLSSKGGPDAFIQKLDSNGNLKWAISAGGPSADYVAELTCDDYGNVIAIGRFAGTVDFDPGAGTVNKTASLGYNVFVWKLDPDGKLKWVETFPASFGFSLTLDANGNVYAAGAFATSEDFEPGAGTTTLINQGSFDVFVAKLDSNGTFQWAKSFGGSGAEYPSSLRLDASGNLILSGQFSGTCDFDPGVGQNEVTAMLDDAYLAKFDANLNLQWVKTIGGIRGQYINTFYIDAAGAFYLTGQFQDSVDFDPGPGVYPVKALDGNQFDGYIEKLDASGNFVWMKHLAGNNGDAGIGITGGPDGAIYVHGWFWGDCSFPMPNGPLQLNSNGNDDIFQLKMDTSGAIQWVLQTGGLQADHGYSMLVSASGSIYTTGYFFLTTDFDPTSGIYNYTSNGSSDAFVQRLNPQPCTPTAGTHTVTACSSYQWIDGKTYTASNTTATHTLMNAAGCDSVVTLNLTINTVSDVSTTVSNGEIKANLSGASYRWMDCNAGFAVMLNATGQSYTPSANGSFAVEITENGCVDTSSCVTISNVGLANTALAAQMTLYPNPSSGAFVLDLGKTYSNAHLKLLDVNGKEVWMQKATHTQQVSIKTPLAPGVYMLQVQVEEGMAVLRVVVE